MPATPTTFASDLTYAGLAPETVQGTPVTPSATILLNKDPAAKDNQVYLEDMGTRNAMAEVYGAVQGPLSGDVQLDGDVRTDTIGYLLGNILGDWTATGTANGASTTLSAQANVGATSISTAASIPASSIIQIGTGATAEIFTTGTPTGTGPYTIPLAGTSGIRGNGALVYQHAVSQVVQPLQTPYTYQFALQNAGVTQSQLQTAQAHSLTVTDWSGVTASTGARAYPGAMLSDLSFTIDPTKLLTFSAKATTWGSVAAASTPAVTISGLGPQAAWTAAVGIGGPASGGTLVNNVQNLSVSLTRKLKLYPTLSAKNPYIIRQGKFGITGKFSLVAADESALTNYLTNVQPQLQVVMSTGSGATTQKLQFDLQQVYYKTSSINRSSEAVGFDVDFTGIANTTNIGASGGFSPCLVTIQNAVAVGVY